MGTPINIITRFIEKVWNESNPDAAKDFLSESYVDYSYTPGNIEGLKTQIKELAKSFPDHKSVIDDAVVHDNKVALRMHLTGTHQGEFRGNPGTGKKFNVKVVRWFTLDDGKIADHWALLDTFNLFRQLGIDPSPAHACQIPLKK